MKTLLKYISLLIIGRLIIPLTLCDTCLCSNRPITAPLAPVATPADGGKQERKSFSFIHDVIEKLLPAASFLK